MDSCIVLISVLDIIMQHFLSGHALAINPTLIRVIRVLRIARGKQMKKTKQNIIFFFSFYFSIETIENGQRYSISFKYGS